jgi:N-acylneuraminate cytidylyltransferase
MTQTPHIVAFIPVRGGSRSIPKKNIKLLAGRPLVYWVLDAAVHCDRIARTYVSTDDDEIADVVVRYGSDRVEIVRRSEETATDTASTESALLEFAEQVSFDHVVLIQATSPLLMADHLIGGVDHYLHAGADSLVSVVRQRRFLWRETSGGWGEPVNYGPRNRPRRQEFDGFLVENGAFYVTRRDTLMDTKSRLGDRICLFEMPAETYTELDEPDDWRLLAQILEERRRRGSIAVEANRARRIKLFLTDVDGVLTDAGMYYDQSGDAMKKFNTRDGKGLELLRRAGIKTGILTSESTEMVAQRARKLQLDYAFQGVTDKLSVLQGLLSELGLAPDEVAYVGDDLNDLEILGAVGLSAAPADAVPEVREAVHYVCRAGGGEGCVREVASQILAAR